MKRDICIPVSTAQALAESLDLRQVIIVAWDGETTHVVTYGGTDADSANAARGGNLVKKALGWPASLDSESPKVLALQARITELEAQVASGGLPNVKLPKMAPEVQSSVHIVEGTEYERGWGQRPDGYVAFMSEAAARRFIIDFDRRWNNAASAPDEYTKYEYIGLKTCSPEFRRVVSTYNEGNGGKHFSKLSELLE